MHLQVTAKKKKPVYYKKKLQNINNIQKKIIKQNSYFLAALSLGKVLANWCRTYYNISGGASEIKGSKAGR